MSDGILSQSSNHDDLRRKLKMGYRGGLPLTFTGSVLFSQIKREEGV